MKNQKIITVLLTLLYFSDQRFGANHRIHLSRQTRRYGSFVGDFTADSNLEPLNQK
ncbi:hypothetical protein BH18ACI1_BH18ACI1_04890 [soil metagenome]